MTGFEMLVGTPCAGCRHMSWNFLRNQPDGLCTVKARNKYGRWVFASAKCEKLGYEFYEPEEWKVEEMNAWAKRNGVLTPENAVPLY